MNKILNILNKDSISKRAAWSLTGASGKRRNWSLLILSLFKLGYFEQSRFLTFLIFKNSAVKYFSCSRK